MDRFYNPISVNQTNTLVNDDDNDDDMNIDTTFCKGWKMSGEEKRKDARVDFLNMLIIIQYYKWIRDTKLIF